MHRVLVLGSGKIGSLIAGLLAECGDYAVHLADSRAGVARDVAQSHASPAITPVELDATRRADLEHYVGSNDIEALVSALPYYCNHGVAEATRATDCHYFDLTEDVERGRDRATRLNRRAHGVRATVRAGAGLRQRRPSPCFLSVEAAQSYHR